MHAILFKVAFVLSLGIFFVPKSWKQFFAFAVSLLLGVTSVVWAVNVLMSGQTMVIDLGIPFWKENPALTIDSLSAFFILLIDFICLTGLLYGWGYLKPYFKKKSAITLSLHLFSFIWLHASMLQVVTMRHGISFLISWEMMSLSSFLLVIFEGEKEATLKTGINYLIQMHVGFFLILGGFLTVFHATGELTFDALAGYFSNHNNFWLFLLFFMGFGIKAGFVPMHSWLPHAHTAAPSHVSGVMSGIMIKMGIYGIIRVLFQVQADVYGIGLFLTVIAIITAITGILYAIFQHDIKKILAYSSIENIGIIGIGLGAFMLGKHLNKPELMTLGIAGALFHTMNHALYKSMLFYSAGNVYYATHTRDQNLLGGLIKKMPFTGMSFLVGSIAICAIPPFNGFISEFLIYSGTFQTIGKASFSESLISIGIILCLVLIGGLSVYAFSKAFGLTFLGSRRFPENSKTETEVPLLMRISSYVIIAAMMLVAIFPYFFLQVVANAVAVVPDSRIAPILAENSHALQTIGLVNLILISVFALIYSLRSLRKNKIDIQFNPTWGCGYSAGDFRHQYTSTSFNDSLRQLADGVLMIERKLEPLTEAEIFPAQRSFSTETKDLIEEKVVLKPVNRLIKELPKAGWAQTGYIHHYLLYPLVFLLIIGLLTFLNVF